MNNTHPLKDIGFWTCPECGTSGHVAVREGKGKQVRFVDCDPAHCPMCGHRFDNAERKTVAGWWNR